MEKTKIERLANELNAQIEITINKNNSSVYIYDKTDLYIYGYTKEFLSDAINEAVQKHYERRDKNGGRN